MVDDNRLHVNTRHEDAAILTVNLGGVSPSSVESSEIFRSRLSNDITIGVLTSVLLQQTC